MWPLYLHFDKNSRHSSPRINPGSSWRTFCELAYIDVVVELDETLERMVMPFYRSAGINSGKKEGQLYPILGLKETTGPFHEFTRGINRMGNGLLGGAKQGWLVKNLSTVRRGPPTS